MDILLKVIPNVVSIIALLISILAYRNSVKTRQGEKLQEVRLELIEASDQFSRFKLSYTDIRDVRIVDIIGRSINQFDDALRELNESLFDEHKMSEKELDDMLVNCRKLKNDLRFSVETIQNETIS